jgi:peptide/nickel transport system ATP-binding protein
LFLNPKHPYTEALLSAAPNADPATRYRPRIVLEGEAADSGNLPSGCAFHPRCAYAQDRCRQERPALVNIADADEPPHQAACHFAEELELVGITGEIKRTKQ